MIQIDCPGIEANHGAPVCYLGVPKQHPLHVLVGLNLEAKNKSRGKGLIVVLVHAVVLQVMRVPLMGSGLLGCAYGFLWKA